MCVELFGGILPVATVVAEMGQVLAASFSAEICPDAHLVAATQHPQVIQLGDVTSLDLSPVKTILWDFPAMKVIFAGGVPCEDVSQLSSQRVGAHGERSGLRDYYKSAYYELKGRLGPFVFPCSKQD